ncbi:hypothetical protein Cri9333_4661 [Crinalium epipsammum PCC 9333]|uniref:Uncharacterized protein n=2 Tax=Crinalium TaxID=241421 RepID=K9W7K2_9CYAN|nr:hypothetical protein Cri9333_4661 [Crinalium epipsammum PCC 9333]
MKELPDTKTLLELLQSAKEAEEKARTLYEMGVQFRQELETKLEERQKLVETPQK